MPLPTGSWSPENEHPHLCFGLASALARWEQAKARGKGISECLGEGPVHELEGQAREGSEGIVNGPDSTSSEENASEPMKYGRDVHPYCPGRDVHPYHPYSS